MATQAPTPKWVLFPFASFLIACLFAGCLTSRPTLLNSERIEKRFGSYGIEILAQNEQRRVSNLYSTHGTDRICRTLAVVTFTAPMPEAIVSEHQSILIGGSIGAVFKKEGWLIRKHHQAVTSLTLNSESSWIAELMHIGWPQELAVHTYQFEISRGQESIPYATISEIHHPNYLDASSLRRIYPNIPSGHFPGIGPTLKQALVVDPRSTLRTTESN